MQVTFGLDFFEAKNNSKTVPVQMDTSRLINPHMLIVGSSGVGKSYTLRRAIADAIRSSKTVRFHVFDVHGDLHIPGASEVRFSETAPYGLNPLRVNPDPDYGGVRKSIQRFLRVINQASNTKLGVRQEAVLSNLLLDCYREFGFEPSDPRTWALNAIESTLVSSGADNRLYLNVPISEKDQAKAFGARWDGAVKLWWVHADRYKGDITRWKPAYKERAYPTVEDVLNYTKRLHVQRFLGSDQKGVQALDYLNKCARSFQRKLLESARFRNQDIVDIDQDEEMEEARSKAVEAYRDYTNAVRTGFELESLLKYESAEELKSVANRLGNLWNTGVFKSTPPPFDESANVWRYNLAALGHEEKKMMVLFLMQDLFNKAMQRGESSTVAEVIVLDELSTYTSGDDEKGDGIIGVVAREARKFGLGLWAANQSPANVPESLISSVGTKIVLGLDEMFWDSAVRKLRIEAKQLAWIQPQHTMAVQLKERGALKSRWWWVQIPQG